MNNDGKVSMDFKSLTATSEKYVNEAQGQILVKERTHRSLRQTSEWWLLVTVGNLEGTL